LRWPSYILLLPDANSNTLFIYLTKHWANKAEKPSKIGPKMAREPDGDGDGDGSARAAVDPKSAHAQGPAKNPDARSETGRRP
jgi:hypothetical protein